MGGPAFPSQPSFDSIPVATVAPTQPAMPPVIGREVDGDSDYVLVSAPVDAIQGVFEHSDGWTTSAWSTPALVLTRAALRHMLAKVEREMGSRKLIPDHRVTRA